MTLAGTLYAILDLGYVRDEDAPHMLRQLLEGGADIVQLRGKNRSIDELSALAKKLLPLTTAANVPLIVNDHAQIARSVNVQGVHVGQDDEAIASVRTKAGRPIIVGKSTHNLEQAIAAEGEGADYIGFGPLFATPTKPEYVPIGLANINEVQQRVSIPIFCIGGIKIENLAQVINAGAQRVVIVSGLLEAPDPADYARKAKQTLVTRHSPLATSP
ncbi:MAG: thiamine phosphate synthase [Chthoniobacterales bacterium]